MPLHKKIVGSSYAVKINGVPRRFTASQLIARKWTQCMDCKTWYPPKARQHALCDRCRYADEMWGKVAPNSSGL